MNIDTETQGHLADFFTKCSREALGRNEALHGFFVDYQGDGVVKTRLTLNLLMDQGARDYVESASQDLSVAISSMGHRIMEAYQASMQEHALDIERATAACARVMFQSKAPKPFALTFLGAVNTHLGTPVVGFLIHS